MTDLQIFVSVLLKVAKNFWPLVPVVVGGLGWLYFEEKGEERRERV